jgi:hypothetical protein
VGRFERNRDYVQRAMGSLRSRLRARPDGDPLIWPIPGELACSQRPLRDHPEYQESNPLPVQSFPLINNWIRRVRDSGIRSIMCLLTPHPVATIRWLARSWPPRSVSRRRLYGSHLPVFDEVHPEDTNGCLALGEPLFAQAYEAFKELPKPVLLHCSAGIDRSSPVAAQIVVRSNKQLFARQSA